MEGRWNSLQNMDMGNAKNRSQVKINFDSRFKDSFDKEVERRKHKPAALATAVLEWWLSQPRFVQNLAIDGLDSVPEAARPMVAQEIAKHLAGLSTLHPVGPDAAKGAEDAVFDEVVDEMQGKSKGKKKGA
jgi:hypothetical protein